MILFDGSVFYDEDPSLPGEEWLTVADDLSDIEAEEGVDVYGSEYEPETEVQSVDYQAIASKAIEEYLLQSLEDKYQTEEESTEAQTLSVLDNWLLDSEVSEIQAAPQLRAGNPVMPEGKAYKLKLDNRTVYAWFSSSAELGTTDEGYLYNESSNNITGIIADSLDGVSLNSYNDTITVTPLLTGSGNNNAYRYGSRVYVTDYYVSGSTLVNSVNYISSAEVLEKPDAGYGFTRFQLAGLGLLLLLVILMLLRGLWRDR